MKFLQLSILSLLLSATTLSATANPLGRITSIRTAPLCESNGSADKNGPEQDCPKEIQIITAGGILKITPLTENIFRVTTLPGDNNTDIPVSQCAILPPSLPGSRLNMSAGIDGVTLSTKTTTIKIDRASGLVNFYNSQGNLLLQEKGGIDNSNPKDRRISFSYPKENDMLYGAGERGHSLALNGDTLVMYNRQNYGYTGSDPRISQMGITVPYFTSSRGYGVLFDDHTKSTLILGDPIEYIAPDAIGPVSYYFINGNGSMAGTAKEYALLTGHQELPPFWALGYITSKYGYHDAKEAIGVIDTLKTKGYPVDGMVLDLFWYGVETDMGRLDWDKNKWPDPKGFLADLKKKGVNVTAITQPYINKKGAIDNYNYLVDNALTVRDAEGNNHDVTIWVGESGMFDVSNPATRQWYWNKYKKVTDDGIAAWWGDLGEPEVHPSTIRHYNGQTAEQYHNVYGNEWSRIIYDGFKKNYPDKRLMLLMRGGTAGLQRYNVFPWTTDVSRSWGGLEPQIKLMLNSGLSGLGYMSSDIGGFAVDPDKPTDPELYVRWLQMGAFTPMLRTHAQLKPEPYHYPEVEAISKKFIKQRYEWLPYNYTLAYENALNGWPLARPLDFHGDNPGEKYAFIDDEYLWGDNVLIAPVLKKGARSRKVIFPAGTWIDYNRPSISYRGGSTATVKAPLDELPMFVRKGAFIPLYRLPIDNVSQYEMSDLTIQYFPAEELTSYTLFDDDRKSPSSLTDGNCMLTSFQGKSQNKSVTIEIKADRNPDRLDWMPSTRNMTFEIMNQKRMPRTVSIETEGESKQLPKHKSNKNISEEGWYYNAHKQIVIVNIPFRGESTKIVLN